MQRTHVREGNSTLASNLTRDEATDRARLLDVESYRVELDLTGGGLTFGSVTTVRFRCARPGASTFIDLTAPAVGEITLNGARVSPDHFAADRISLDGLAGSNELRVVADCVYSRSGEGLHRFTDPVDGGVYLYSDLETFDAHRVYACFDQPDLKATFELSVTVQEDWQVVSNMAPAQQAAEGTAGQVPAGVARRWTFPPTPLLPTYITAVAAGPYHVVRDEHDGIPLGIFCRQSLASYLDPDEIFEVTRQGLDYFHNAFGVRYPFGKYDQLFVPEFKAGAMENAGCVTFLEAYVFRSRVTEAYRESRAETILHEMAHMWFGDLVTMRWWDDLWLNESFATWAGTVAQAEATRWPTAWTTFAQAWKAWAYRQDQLPSSHPIAADIPDIEAVEVNFDGITYAKGAAVLKQLVAHVGRENFLTGVHNYFGQHAYGNATLGDLLAALEQSSGRNLADWSKKWLEAPGVNTLRPEFTCDDDGRFAAFAVLQEAAPSRPVLRPHRLAIGLYDRVPQEARGGTAQLTRRHRVELDIDGERTEVPELVGQARPDLVLVNDDDLTYAKIRLDERSLRTLVSGIGEITDSLPAALCWAAAWDMCRDAEMPARDYVSLALSGVDAIGDITVLQTVVRQAAAAARRFADPAWRAEGLERIARALRELLQAAEPGSDRQLAYAEALAGVATSAGDLALLAGLLDGSTTIEGLAIDTELRWRLLHRLASRGVAGAARIDAELERDATDAGGRHAAACQAARPDPAAKEETWNLITSGKLSNATFRATLGGFADPDQDELLKPYTARYFDVVAGIWSAWGSDMAQYFTEYGYPRWEVTPEAVAAAGDYLERSDPPAALRRLLAEGRDDLARALRCRQRDAEAT
jgi:aminopeptidase N